MEKDGSIKVHSQGVILTFYSSVKLRKTEKDRNYFQMVLLNFEQRLNLETHRVHSDSS